ncbi:hypothetical protein SBA5_580033 [Candidatus Sulfotelmatomonas gaucii]|uniref:Uncharacterized protein n=1 Tax=Candidatus Sulfuritelmatomonas gaucii TaxID=2043161 RepID=A0A2N9LVB2_9BACT|nr:hypothetical protein SBA5_580033 [Candidatus Sulfotelmatomonas gaucii]
MTRTIPTNKAGRDAMDESLNAAAKVRRQLKAGPKPKTRKLPPLFEAVKRLCAEADRGRSLMQKYGLDADDIHLALIYRPADGVIGSRALPPPGNIGPYIMAFEQMGNVEFLGILWWQTTPDSRDKPDSTVTMWITEFADDRRAAIEMLVYRNALTSLPAPER